MWLGCSYGVWEVWLWGCSYAFAAQLVKELNEMKTFMAQQGNNDDGLDARIRFLQHQVCVTFAHGIPGHGQ